MLTPKTSRRELMLATLAASAAPAALADPVSDLAAKVRAAAPISGEEREIRIAKAQALMRKAGLGALLVEAGASLDYFTGVRWWRSERTTAALIPADGQPIIVTPAFEEPSVRETLMAPADVRPWNEHESPFERLAQAATDLKVSGPIGVEATTRYYIVNGLEQASGRKLAPGDVVVRGCRMIKSAAELRLLELANAVTLEAIRKARAGLRAGMTSHDVSELIADATAALGGKGGEGALVLLNEASAYPHGSIQPQTIRDGSVVLIDCGCQVQGYQSDISRTIIFGTPSKAQRKLWDTVRRGQAIVFETARPGVPCGAIDDAVRAYYEAQGFGPGYRLPGLSHRTGHGIGMEGHESPYLVRGDATPLAPGMCFSNEPGLYIPGSFGVRLEDCWRMTETGPQPFTPLAKSIDDPV
eukprot:gene10683-10757_t